jgi:hypothetical protein
MRNPAYLEPKRDLLQKPVESLSALAVFTAKIGLAMNSKFNLCFMLYIRGAIVFSEHNSPEGTFFLFHSVGSVCVLPNPLRFSFNFAVRIFSVANNRDATYITTSVKAVT